MVLSLKEGQTKKGLILKIYELLQHEGNDYNMDVKEKWELQTNITISDEDLEETFKAGDKLVEGVWLKGKMRYFNTPSVTSKYKNTSELCWRGCGLIGDFTHFLGLHKTAKFLEEYSGGDRADFRHKLWILHYSSWVYTLRIWQIEAWSPHWGFCFW